MSKIGIINYGMGNLKSLELIFESLDVETKLINNSSEFVNFNKVILPGVGNFEKAINNIRNKEFDKALIDYVNNNKLLLGICLGMQLLFDDSQEFSEESSLSSINGLGLIPGRVESLAMKKIKIPHVGFNQVNLNQFSPLFKNIKNHSDFYFTHSFANIMTPSSIVGITKCELNFTSYVERGNVYGSQFHPELSHNIGRTFLKNFSKL